MAESDIFVLEWADDYDFAKGSWLQSVFVELYAFLFPKIGLQNVLQKANFKAMFRRPLRATATTSSLKPTRNKGSDQTVSEKCHNVTNYAAYAT